MVQRFQNKVLGNIVDAPWYIRNSNLHHNLGTETVAEIIKKIAESQEQRLHSHVNVGVIWLLEKTGLKRRHI